MNENLSELMSSVAREVCNRCEFNQVLDKNGNACARTAETVVVNMSGLMHTDEFVAAPDDETIHLEVETDVYVDRTKKEVVDQVETTQAHLAEEARRCSVIRSRAKLSELVGRSTTEFVPVTLYSKTAVLKATIPR